MYSCIYNQSFQSFRPCDSLLTSTGLILYSYSFLIITLPCDCDAQHIIVFWMEFFLLECFSKLYDWGASQKVKTNYENLFFFNCFLGCKERLYLWKTAFLIMYVRSFDIFFFFLLFSLDLSWRLWPCYTFRDSLKILHFCILTAFAFVCVYRILSNVIPYIIQC